jgi:hypothetical protein
MKHCFGKKRLSTNLEGFDVAGSGISRFVMEPGPPAA